MNPVPGKAGFFRVSLVIPPAVDGNGVPGCIVVIRLGKSGAIAPMKFPPLRQRYGGLTEKR